MEVLTVIVSISLLPTIQDLINWLMLVCIRVIITKYDVDDDVSLGFI